MNGFYSLIIALRVATSFGIARFRVCHHSTAGTGEFDPNYT